MTVYVDEVHRYPTSIACFKGGSCHMTADTLEELHLIARLMGLRPEWFQDTHVPHYDLTPHMRYAALAAGAVFVPAKEQARKRLNLRVVA